MEYIFTLFGVVWVMPERVEDLLNSWNQRLGETRSHDFGCDSPLSHGAYGMRCMDFRGTGEINA